ncbi:Rexo1 protein [Lentinula aff. detonsa]|nr:Rexo1 protein [Lentinula aff. detonsa]
MFSTLGLFASLQCPQRDSCTRLNCIFSHKDSLDLPPPTTLHIPVDEPKVSSSSSAGSPIPQVEQVKTVPAKRTVTSSPLRLPNSRVSTPTEPPRKLQKLDSSQKRATQAPASTGAPVLRVTPATSTVAIPVRQAMLKTLHDHFLILYENILASNSHLATEHALKQEQEVYASSNKFTYRNAVIQSVAALKRRVPPTSIHDPSVGTEADIIARAEAKESINELQVTSALLEPHIASLDDLKGWGYVVEIPPNPGGLQPSMEGKPVKCERCGEMFVVRRLEAHDPARQECLHHWGRPYSRVANGERTRVYSCCSKDVSDKGCVHGPHVFYESEPEILHLRHAFSELSGSVSASSSSASTLPLELLDVVALDCEMIYTTGGMRVARVSVIDGSAKSVFDELVRMDEGVDILDFNTRFSGITPEMHAERAILPLASIRESLNTLIGKDTVLVGHALENDLKTLRIVHHRCVDTVLLYPHPRGAPYRRSLRDLAREHLNLKIQEGGGSTGHSSLEDAIATLDLVRLYLVNSKKSLKRASSTPSASGSTTSSTTTVRPTLNDSRQKVTPLSGFMKQRRT